MVTKSTKLLTVGQSYHQFVVTKVLPIPELQCTLIELTHTPTGAQVIHIDNDDPENLFCLSFQTLPYDSNGVAHILEHTVLCGSKKFPIKDPFFAMSRRSLNTFMNALTGADFTCYPAASQVKADFYNLLEVYLDAVFHANLNELSFLQEGHRLEFANPSDPTTSLERKGIVFNEMKGALSSASSRLAEAINEALFPDVMYGFNSGGEPKSIPSLSYQNLLDFYQKFYHPSRCLFYFYGNLPLEEHLDFIDKHTLSHFTKAEPLPPIPFQPRFKQPTVREISYPVGSDEKTEDKIQIAFGWLTCHIHDQLDALALTVLQIVLLDTDASPLKMALLKSGLCKQVSSFIDVELHEIPWGVILKGCNSDQTATFKEIIFDQFKSCCEVGIPLELIENALHQLEFHGSEITGDHTPFGLSLFIRAGLLKQHGVPPEAGLTMHHLFEELHAAIIKNPAFFKELIHKYFLDNSHFVTLIMKPNRALGEEESKEERDLLAQIKSKLSEEQTEQIIRKAAELAEFQKQQEDHDIDILPQVTLKDVPCYSKNYQLVEEKVDHLTVFFHSVFTNDIIYADLVFDLPDLPESDLPYLRLFTAVLTQMGCKDRNYAQNLDYIQAHTGGIGAGVSLNLQANNHDQYFPTFHLRGKALHRKAANLFSLMTDLLTDAKLDDLARLKEIFFKHFTMIDTRLNQSALKYAINLSASALNAPSKVANDLYGLNYYWKLQEIAKNFEKEGPILLEKILELQKKILCLDHPHLVISCDTQTYQELKSKHFYGLSNLPMSSFDPWKDNYALEKIPSQGRIISSPVAFIGKVFQTVSYTHSDAPALSITAFLFDNLTLHQAIREQGGAYGGGAVCNPMSGNFYFYSYRDPNVTSTLKAFEAAIENLLKGHFSDQDLEEAKLEMVQGLDSPISPGSRAEVAYGWLREGRTIEMRQAFRDKVLNLTRHDIIHVVRKHIIPQFSQGAAVIFSEREVLEKANKELAEEGLPTLIIKGLESD